MKRENFFSGVPWESIASYSRAVRVDHQIFVAGTTATDAKGNIVGVGDAYLQSVQSLKNIEKALRSAGATLADVVRSRIYITRVADSNLAMKAHSEYFLNVYPAATLVVVNALLHKDMLVEIEVDALLMQNS